MFQYSLFRTEKKQSSSTFEQVEKKNPSCPAIVLKLADDARMVSYKAIAVTDTQAAAADHFNTIAPTMVLKEQWESNHGKEKWAAGFHRHQTLGSS
ncbi:hypothetical protein D8674_011885 [Pyrus ussuriensis x Pyrus communis]|uniref:Uncharacterized protein n=1 Tax=Pyrus ussuriensis x Pyrus communis TaxID=2448454 RepID=A0A5N5G0T4_9ROSA|nr:hypothetical protein D8674_011885 [Pyrus ussuriensis x Pyrus communis]